MRNIRTILLTLVLQAIALGAYSQAITSVHGTVSDDMEPLIGATVCEIDGNGRIIESAITDLNGNFTMKIQNPKDKIRFTYVGMKTVTLPINKTTYEITMESATELQEVERQFLDQRPEDLGAHTLKQGQLLQLLIHAVHDPDGY